MEAAGATVNGAQIARLTGASPGTVRGWRRQPGFPAPAGNAGTGARYPREQVAQWLAGAGRWELTPGPRVWREVSHQARGTSLGEAVRAAAVTVAARHAGQAPPGVPDSLAWLVGRAVGEAGAPAVLGDLTDRCAAAVGMPLTPSRVRARFSARQAERDNEAARRRAAAAQPGPHGHPRPDRAAGTLSDQAAGLAGSLTAALAGADVRPGPAAVLQPAPGGHA